VGEQQTIIGVQIEGISGISGTSGDTCAIKIWGAIKIMGHKQGLFGLARE